MSTVPCSSQCGKEETMIMPKKKHPASKAADNPTKWKKTGFTYDIIYNYNNSIDYSN